MLADSSALGVFESGRTGQHYTVGVVIDHQGGRAYDTGAYNSSFEIDDAMRAEAIAEEESVQTVETTELVECDLTVRETVRRVFVQPTEELLLMIYLLDPLTLGRPRSGAEKLCEHGPSQIT
jgi:hypothetical protein